MCLLQVCEKFLYAAITVFIFDAYIEHDYYLVVLCITMVQTLKYVVAIITCNK